MNVCCYMLNLTKIGVFFREEKDKNKTDCFPACRTVCLALQCPVNYCPAKQKRGERIGEEHHLSLDISPKPVVNEVDNCLVILLARVHITAAFRSAIKRFSVSPPPDARINPPRVTPFIREPNKPDAQERPQISRRRKTRRRILILHASVLIDSSRPVTYPGQNK